MKIVTHEYDEDGVVASSEILEGEPAELVALMVARNVLDQQIADGECPEDDDADCETCGGGPCAFDDEFDDAKLDTPWTPANGRVIGPDVVPMTIVDFIDRHCGVALHERIGDYEKTQVVFGPGELRIDGKLVGEVLNGIFRGPEGYINPHTNASSRAALEAVDEDAKKSQYAQAYGAAVNESSEAPVKDVPADLLMNAVARSREQLLRSNHMKDEYGDLIDNSQAIELIGRVARIVLGEVEYRTPQGWAKYFGFEVLNPEIDPNFYGGLTEEDVFLRRMLPGYTVSPVGPMTVPCGFFTNMRIDRDGHTQCMNFVYMGHGFRSGLEVTRG